MEKNMFFVIPEMPSKTFFMLKKKLPDHFKSTPRLSGSESSEKCSKVERSGVSFENINKK